MAIVSIKDGMEVPLKVVKGGRSEERFLKWSRELKLQNKNT